MKTISAVLHQNLLDTYLRTSLLLGENKEVIVDGFGYRVFGDNIVLNYIALDKNINFNNFELPCAFDAIGRRSFVEYEVGGSEFKFKSIDLGSIREIEGYTFSCVKIDKLIGEAVIVLDENSLEGIIGLKHLEFKSLKRLNLSVFHDITSVQDVEYARFGKMEFTNKEDCMEFFKSMAMVNSLKSTKTNMCFGDNYIDTTINDKLSWILNHVYREEDYIIEFDE